MKRIVLVSFALFSAFIISCGTANKTVKKAESKPVKAVEIKKECKNYIGRMENCLKSAKGKDYRKIWSQCEGKVMWDMLKEYQDNGFCFDEEECKQKVMEEINKCKTERTFIFRKYMQKYIK